MFSRLTSSSLRQLQQSSWTARRYITPEAASLSKDIYSTPLSLLALSVAGYTYYSMENSESSPTTQSDVEKVEKTLLKMEIENLRKNLNEKSVSLENLEASLKKIETIHAEENVALKSKVDGLQIALSGKTNSAFVFVKPHACKGTSPEKVQELVEKTFKKAGIRITSKGEMNADVIDKNKHIDIHYGAIASKAVLLKPNELNVPEKGQKQFEEMFGEKWSDAIAASKVYNAKDAAEKLGVDGSGLDSKWSRLKRGKDLIKFGGGFYCGKIDGLYVMNGFYMQMRSAYTNPGEKINYYTVSWPVDDLSWADFRSVVLGATDPTEAPVGSIRRSILDGYEELGLTAKPNTGDNGVHASASPFEALAERANWLGVDVCEDDFGKGLLAAIGEDSIKKWFGDCQVSVDGETKEGATMSVFDALEDLDSDVVLAKVKRIH